MDKKANLKFSWKNAPMTVYEWSRMDLGAMLSHRPVIDILDGMGRPLGIQTLPLMPRLVLADGASLSVQASEHSYCTPRNNFGPYTEVEVGFPSEAPPEVWKEYAEHWETPTDTVYAYIPLSMVLLYIGAHGGIDQKATFKDYKFDIL